jgi:hypothetical protein
MTAKNQPKQCPKCDTTHTKKGVYCSPSCANSRKFSPEAVAKKSEAQKRVAAGWTDEEHKRRVMLLQENNPNHTPNYLSNLFAEDWEFLGIQGKRLRVILEQDGKCRRCGLDEWQGEPLTLEYEHKDGNNGNNDRDNVEALCPNCHSLTSTWRGRNNGSRQKRVRKLIEANKNS